MNRNHLMKYFVRERGGDHNLHSQKHNIATLPAHSKIDSYKSHFFKPMIASSLILALGVSASSAECSIVDGKPSAGCTAANEGNSGMWHGNSSKWITQIAMGTTMPQLTGFGWDETTEGVLKPKFSYNTLDFKTVGLLLDISGDQNNMTPTTYDITIGTLGTSKNIFIFNVGTKILKSDLRISFDKGTPYYFSAGGLDGNLTLKIGNFIVNLSGGIAGDIDSSASNATFNFTSPSKDKTITLKGDISVSSSANNTLRFSNAKAEIQGSILKYDFGQNNIILDLTTLTLNGANNVIETFTALGDTNTLSLTSTSATENAITNLVLGEEGKTKGLLTITNHAKNTSQNPLTLNITNFEGKVAGSTLTISAGAVNIEKLIGEYNSIILGANTTLTLGGGSLKSLETATTGTNTINFAKGATTITKQINTGGINQLTLKGTADTTSAIFKGVMSGTNHFTLNSSAKADEKTNLTLEAGGSTITKLTALSNSVKSMNTLTIANNVQSANTITNLVLGDDASRGQLGFLTIENNAFNGGNPIPLIIETFESKAAKSTLIISSGEVKITNTLIGKNNNIALDSANSPTILTLNSANGNNTIKKLTTAGLKGNTLNFNKKLTIDSLSEEFEDTNLTFVNKVTKDAQDPSRAIYGYLVINSSYNGSTNNAKLAGTYRMAIVGDEISKTRDSKETKKIAVATIKKRSGAGMGGTQDQLRGKGVIDLGTETEPILTRNLALQTLSYYVDETDENGNKGPMGSNGYITYFINAEESSITPPKPQNPSQPESIQQSILSNIALSSTGLYLANFNSLNKRMGELRDNARSQGVWARGFYGSQRNDYGLKSTMNYVSIQAGYDYAFGFDGANNYLGFALLYGHSASKFKDEARAGKNFASIDLSESDLVEVALYNSYVQDSGWYNDTVVKFSYLLNQVGFSGQNTIETFSNKGDVNTYALTLSNEFGYRFKLGGNKEWYIDPQAELGFGYFEGKEFNFSGTKLGVMDSLLVLRSRLGASFGYDFKNFISQELGLSAKLYLGVFGEMDYFNGGDVKFEGGIAESAIKTDPRAVLNVGTNLEIKESTRIYLDFETSFAGKIKTDYKINAGVRYSFGENTGYKPSNAVKKEMEAEEAPIKLKEAEQDSKENKANKA